MTSPRSGRDFVFELRHGDVLVELKGGHQLSVNDSTAALGVVTTYAFMMHPHLQSGAL